MTAFMEAAGYVPAALSALHALGAVVRVWQHRRSGKSGPCRCARPAEREDAGAPGDHAAAANTLTASAVPGPAVVVAIAPPAGGVVAAHITVSVTVGPTIRERGRW
ncbi:hypothetical protein PV721_41205 [Streptomyces sp. MB09-01]|uniref:hypothetical protein n=1 Tax=Streptomyces sp. MB09-01 TaxID=3028666 RepID=UPI0029B2406D|nr:hypothetical protein [Streptomyces sp. MB09-01]MDX3540606.1 hypothetical protein [Streptomyces sp. MB09-01]